MAKSVWALGVGASGSGYPHAEGLIAVLSTSEDWRMRDAVRWLPGNVHLWRLGKADAMERMRIVFHLAWRVALLPVDLIRARASGAMVFTPYPSLFTLAVARLMPRLIRPRIVADCFISVWDSAFADRQMGVGPEGFGSLVKRFESWCLRAADAVLVDTVENAQFFEREFTLEAARVHVVPLAVNVEKLLELQPAARMPDAPLRVLYVGTFVPLHGVQVIVDAMRRLSKNDGVELRIIGDGQDAHLLEAALREGIDCPVEWIRVWQSRDDLVAHYAWADVCLGIFGASGKANRVLPFKIYAALAAGRVVVTQREMGSPTSERPPTVVCEASGQDLADALICLKKRSSVVSQFAQHGREYYARSLSERAVAEAWSLVRVSLSSSNI